VCLVFGVAKIGILIIMIVFADNIVCDMF